MYDYHSLDRDSSQSVLIPPNSMQAEQSVLGSLMMDNKTYDLIADVLVESDFYRPNHKLIFRAIEQCVSDDVPFDLVTLSEILKQHRELDKVGGIPYLNLLTEHTPTTANIVAYAHIVKEKSVLRHVIATSTAIGDAAFRHEGKTAQQILDFAEREIFAIAERGKKQSNGFVGIKSLLSSVYNKIEKLYESGSSMTGIPTGFKDLDDLTAGFQPADLVILAGRPSMGKTSCAMNIAEYVALSQSSPVLVFSLEMPSEGLTMRMLSSIAKVDFNRVRTGQLLDNDWALLVGATARLSSAKLFIDDTPALTPSELRARARRVAREHGQIGLIVVDYLQLMQGQLQTDNEVEQVGDISRSLKAMAKELNVPVIALSQLNRNLEQRTNKRPIMSDLRSSGAIEQDADVILFVYRDEVYNPDSQDKGIAELIIGKQRNGPLGTVRLAFLGQYTRFENLAHQAGSDYE